MLLEVRGLCKTYPTPRGKIAAVDGLDLDVKPGEFLAVCGRSGSGKSTLLGMLGGLCRPSGGTVRVEGKDLWSLGTGALADLRAGRFGFMFQFAGLLPNLRAIDNIALPALLGGIGYGKAYDRAKELLGQVGLDNRWDAYPGELSGGEQRRVALARALSNQPVLLLADEPTNDLDEQSERAVLCLLRELHRLHSTTLIVVTHDADLARQADRVISLHHGKLISVTQSQPMALVEKPATTSPPPLEREPALPPLTPAELSPPGAGLGRFLIGFAGWAMLVVFGLWGIDYVMARFQQQAIVTKQVERKKSEELALQQLRADVEDLTFGPDGRYEVQIYVQNIEGDKPCYVLGPNVRIFAQVDRNWQELPASPVGVSENTVHEIAGKKVFRFAFPLESARYDELLRGYVHVRLTNVMIVSENAQPGEDIFQRTDDYYVYLKPQNTSDEEVRKRNGWSEKALVPRWIGMPSH